MMPNSRESIGPSDQSWVTSENHEGHGVSRRESILPSWYFVSIAVKDSLFYFRAATGSRRPASLASFTALSVNSHVKSGSVRPKWP